MSAAPPDQFAVADPAADDLTEARAQLSANDGERAQLRRTVAGVEFRMALRNFRDGLRGMIRVSPLLSVATAAMIGAAWARRGRRRSVRR